MVYELCAPNSESVLASETTRSASVMLERKEIEVAQVEEHLRHIGHRADLLHYLPLGPVNVRFHVKVDLPRCIRHDPGPSLDPDRLGPGSHLLSHLHDREGDLLLFLEFHQI